MIFVLFLVNSFINSKYIIIPLKKYNNDIKDDNLLSKIYSNIYFTELSIGEPKQNIITFINTTSNSNFGISNKYCDSNLYINYKNINKDYYYENSTTFNQEGEGNMKLGAKDILINEQIKFYTNFELTEEISVQNMSLMYNPNNEEVILDDVGYDYILEREKRTTCGYIGFKLGMNYQENNNILDQLKQKGIISNTIFTFIEANKNNPKYKNNNIEFLLVIGEEIYDIFKDKNIKEYISEKYNKDQFVEKRKLNDYINNEGFYFIWKITFNNIYTYINNTNINMEQIKNVFLDNDYGLISGTREYNNLIETNYFKQYEDINKCWQKILKTNDLGNFYYYVCDDDINIDIFPTLFLKSKNLQYEYQLTKDELFIKNNHKIYFLIVFEFSRSNTWKLGKPFLDKYLFSYNYDSKTVGFYNENLLLDETKEINNDSNYMKYIIISIIIFLSLISLILGFFIGRFFYYKRKKNGAYELENSLSYNFAKEENENNDKQKIISINE